MLPQCLVTDDTVSRRDRLAGSVTTHLGVEEVSESYFIVPSLSADKVKWKGLDPADQTGSFYSHSPCLCSRQGQACC